MNIFFPPNQGQIFFSLTFVGVFLGVVYDILRIKRKLLGSHAVILFFDDILFMLFSSAAFVFSIFVFNNGILRWLEVFFCIFGFVFYRLSFSKIIMMIFEIPIKLIHAFVHTMLKLLIIPLKFIGKMFWRTLHPLFLIVYRFRQTDMIYKSVKRFQI